MIDVVAREDIGQYDEMLFQSLTLSKMSKHARSGQGEKVYVTTWESCLTLRLEPIEYAFKLWLIDLLSIKEPKPSTYGSIST